MSDEEFGEFLTIKQAADRMQVSKQTLYNWINKGTIKPLITPSGTKRIPIQELFKNHLIITSKEDTETQIIDISKYEPNRQEPTGLKEKFWFSNRDGNWYWNLDGHEFLFKVGRPGTGENWAEVVACELCKLLGMPHAEYKLAKYKEKQGVISPSFVPRGTALILGNEMLQHIVKGYRSEKQYNQRKHTLVRVIDTLSKDIVLPLNWECIDGLETAIDVFVGYLLFDTWIANTDRHHENWGVIRDISTTKYHLAPTFDHASSLGSHENDINRQERLESKDKNRQISAYVTKARSALYGKQTDENPLFTIDAFFTAAQGNKISAQIWLNQLNKIGNQDIINILDKIPNEVMTEITKHFTLAILSENKKRLQNLHI
jgi:excisionase family DNA binding protein